MLQALRQLGLNLYLKRNDYIYIIAYLQIKLSARCNMQRAELPIRFSSLEFSLVKCFLRRFVHIRYRIRHFIKIDFS